MPVSIFCVRFISVAFSFLGAAGNAIVAAQIISLYRSLRWEAVESEWEESYASWNLGIDSIKIVWALLSVYFSVSALACLIGFFGSLKRHPSFVKLYRDYSVVDLSVSAIATLLFALASFRPVVRTTICEELSRQPELMRDLAEAGLDVENCEPWFERAAVALLGIMAVILVVRLQFTLAVSNYYSQLCHGPKSYHPLEDQIDSDLESSPGPRRIFLLPHRRNNNNPASSSNNEDVVVYAPVPLSSLTPQQTHDLDAAEAWFSHSDYQNRHGNLHHHHNTHTHHRRSSSTSKSQSPNHHHHHHHHHRRHSSGAGIRLPTLPDEPLLPAYSSPKQEA